MCTLSHCERWGHICLSGGCTLALTFALEVQAGQVALESEGKRSIGRLLAMQLQPGRRVDG